MFPAVKWEWSLTVELSQFRQELQMRAACDVVLLVVHLPGALQDYLLR